MPEIIAAAGERVGAFTASTCDGTFLSDGDLVADTVVAFFSPGCGACSEQVPQFLELAENRSSDQGGVLAVVVGADGSERALVESLSQVGRAVVDPGHEIEQAFQVRGYPSYALVGADRRVAASGGLESVAGIGVSGAA
jgi:thiol-disulfide isomerase/thioredoxin